jgi:AraC family transcriptional regulator of adaptative response/methylated-DNA-[protein]-cysteine methyltransferase
MCPEGVFCCFAREFSLEDLLCGRGSIFRWEDMYVRGTPLQVAVWREMFSLGPGELVTYSQLALRCGYPKAVRAVASAVGKNPFSLIVPCHRVLRSEAFDADGEINPNKLGNYYWGKELKLKILQKEGLI